MITLDICILIFLLFWSIRGFFKGLASEMISLVIWLAAIYLTLNFFQIPLNYIQEHIVSSEISMVITYILIFILTFIISMISSFFVSKLMGMFGLYSFDKSFGFIFGLLKGSAFLLLITFFLMTTELSDHEMITNSQFIPYFDHFLNNYMKSSDSLFDSFQLKI